MSCTYQWVFNYWTVNGVKVTGNPITVTINANTVLVAHYKLVISF